MKAGWLSAFVVFGASIGSPLPGPVKIALAAVAPPVSVVDAPVFTQLARLGIQPAPLSSDAVFLRRAFLDVIGTLPAADEARAFLADPDPGKRSALVDRLLARDEFADYWAMKWSDLLRVKSGSPIDLSPNAAQAYHRWIRTSVRDNLPYDRFVRELLTESGSSVRVPPVNFYRAIQSRDPPAIASAVALTFMGVRADKWPADRLAGMGLFFSRIGYKQTSEWKEEIVFFQHTYADTVGRRDVVATFPDGTRARILPDVDPREAFVNWLVAVNNPWFARNIVNRIWSWLLGRGIVHEADDIRPDNPPSNPDLLTLLERELVASQYDLRHIYRLILNSKTYQLAAVAANDRGDVAASYPRYVLRPLDAEVLIDALNEVTGTTERYSSLIPEPDSCLPEGQRAIALADGSITSSFLEMFGRPARDSGLESERGNSATAAQRVRLLASSGVRRKVEHSPKLETLVRRGDDARPAITDLYLTILSRFPTDGELRAAREYARKTGGDRRVAGLDLAWALINSEEFLYRH